IPSDVLPAVRDQVVINYLTDGPDMMGQASAVLSRPSQQMILAVSPAIDTTMAVPTQAGANAHWPAFQGTNTNQGFPNPVLFVSKVIQAKFSSGNDFVVTVAANQFPDGASIRIYPQQFVTIPAITQEPSFLRGDGGAALATAGNATKILLPNP